MTTPRIFINYRREDASGHAGWLHERLAGHFGHGQVFMDIDSIPAGVDFVDVIERTVQATDVVIVLIGTHWLTAVDAAGRRRLDDPHDFVRLEIAAALNRDITVIPALVQHATMPRADELPEDLASLARHNAIDLTDERWAYDVGRLIRRLEEIGGGPLAVAEQVRRAEASAAPPASPPTPMGPPPPPTAPRKRSVVVPAVIALLVLGGIAGGAVALMSGGDSGEETQGGGGAVGGVGDCGAPEGGALGDRVLMPCPTGSRMEGEDVAELQSRLNGLGFSVGDEQGVYGPGTVDAVTAFETCVGLPPDGVVESDFVTVLEAVEADPEQLVPCFGGPSPGGPTPTGFPTTP